MTWDAGYTAKQLQRLVGGKIVAAEASDEDESMPFMVVQMDDGREYVVWVMSDQEGNAAGSVDIVRTKQAEGGAR
jgi:hypothetical protein